MKSTLLVISFNHMKVFIFGLLLLALSSCAVPMKSQEMLPQFDFYDTIHSKKFSHSISIRNVEVSKGTGGFFPITPEEYRTTLVSAFRQANLYATKDKAEYALDSIVTDLRQPAVGFNLTVTAVVNYQIRRLSDNSMVLLQNVTTPCTKGMADAFDSTIRLRMASGCAVGENITHVIKVIAQE